MKGYLGVDVGSVSVKLALIDENEELIDSVYLRNSGVMETLRNCFKRIKIGDYDVLNVGVTGSGRKLVGTIIGTDCIKTEILAHSLSALHYYPDVRTLIDIGGEDAKLVSINRGVLESFVLNSICSAGTGSSLEAIATRMGVKIEDVGDIALQSKGRVNLSTKCGVFLQSSVVTKLNLGYDKSDILMGVCRSLVHNYLSMAKGIKLEPPYVYQSATAKNKGIVRAFEEELGSKLIVPDNCEVMGAIGMAIIAKNEHNGKEFRFNGNFDDYKIKTRTAKGCDNNCELSLVYDGEKYLGGFGNRCEKCCPK